jgi:hypothetical protein
LEGPTSGSQMADTRKKTQVKCPVSPRQYAGLQLGLFPEFVGLGKWHPISERPDLGSTYSTTFKLH